MSARSWYCGCEADAVTASQTADAIGGIGAEGKRALASSLEIPADDSLNEARR